MRIARFSLIVTALIALVVPFALAQASVNGAWKLTFQTDQGTAEADGPFWRSRAGGR